MISYLEFISNFKKATEDAERDLSEITLIAVSKKKPPEAIKQVIELKHKSFGENQIQEVEKKWTDIRNNYKNLKLHFIGSIQSRKVKSIYDNCDTIHSLDRMKIVTLFNKIESEKKIFKEYFIQINTGNEPQKSGVKYTEAETFISECLYNNDLNIKGLMCLPPVDEQPQEHFLRLRDLGKKFNLPYLSMGMSADYAIALKCGATHIRIGTQIFGERT
mgnify:FL=1|tara:strand:+ start:6786 stop:7439 length:654 start_codon:yes stop_codon:yes gene_type:complete